MLEIEKIATAVERFEEFPVVHSGFVEQATPTKRIVVGLSGVAALGDQVEIVHSDGMALGEIVEIDTLKCVSVLYQRRNSAYLGAPVYLRGAMGIRPDASWLGRIVDALGRPSDGLGPLRLGEFRPCDTEAPPAVLRGQLANPIRTGVKAIDIFAPIVEGQRLGIFAGSGVGKSTLLGMIGASASVDVVVTALVGERSREVSEMLNGSLSNHREKSVTVVSTGDETSLMRRQALRTAVTICEYFRDTGARVLLLVDSITRAAHAMRDVALSAGEPPVSRGYPPSVFSEMTRLAERCGKSTQKGSITGIFCVLVDGDDMEEPIADAARGTFDGHIVLSRSIAESGRFPAIDPISSLSRLAHIAFTEEEAALSVQLRRLVAKYEETKDLRLLGGYKPGGDLELDRAIELVPRIFNSLHQSPNSGACKDAFKELSLNMSN